MILHFTLHVGIGHTYLNFSEILFLCCCLVAQSCLILLQLHGLQTARLLCPYNFPGNNPGVGCNFLLQGIFLTLGSNPHLLHWQADSLPLSHLGSPNRYVSESEVAQSCPTLCNPMDCSLPGSSSYGIFQARRLEWVAVSFSRRSSQPRD